MKNNFSIISALICCVLFSIPALGQTVEFKDPSGDDNGPGTYTYPTDPVYKKGSFDLLGFKMTANGDRFDVGVQVNSTLEDQWKMGVGYSIQMILIFIDTDHKTGSGFIEGTPGLNVQFAAADAWDKCIILSPQTQGRVISEVAKKAANMAGAIVVPGKTAGSGSFISASIPASAIGSGDPAKWGFQIVMQGSEGFPGIRDMLSIPVNEYEGQYRFGGGNDGYCDPHVLDLFAGKGVGSPSEVGLQQKMLGYECSTDGDSKKMAILTMIRK